MKTELIDVIFPTFVAIAAFYILYVLLLRNDSHVLIRRCYLIGTLLFSLAIPLIHFTIIVPDTSTIAVLSMDAVIYPKLSGEALVANPGSFIDFIFPMAFWEIITAVYLIGAIVCFFFLIIRLFRLLHFIHISPKKQDNGFVLVLTDKKICPVSFFHYIIINESHYAETESAAIILHEQQHIKQWHSLDRMLMEFAIVLQWFNPAVWLLSKELRHVHEYIADQGVLRNGVTINHYLQLLFRQATGMLTVEIGNNFSQCLTFKRIKMMKSNSSKGTITKVFLSVPLAAVLVAIFCVTTSCESNRPANDAEGTIEPVTEAVEEAAPITDSVYAMVDELPEFPGGQDELMKFLSENLNYPKAAKKDKIQGTVNVTFAVETDGSVSDVKILRGIGGGCDEEALRVVNMMPKWKAGKANGTPVRVQFNLPIRFTQQPEE